MIHTLKTIQPYYEQVAKGIKTFEVRKADRNFKVGDMLVLQEWSEESGYTGGEIKCQITYLLSGGQFGIDKDYCVMGIKEYDNYF